MDFQGCMVDGYKIIKKIAQNNHTHVYQCERDYKIYAMKILTLGIKNVVLKRFGREIEISSKIKNKYFINVYACGQSKVEDRRGVEQNIVYFVMEFLSGPSLQNIARTYHFSEEEIMYIGGELIKAISYLKQKNTVHRDIKPSNIMITRNFRVVIADFGIAKDASCDNLTKINDSMIGTVYYTAPEIFLAADDKIDSRSDLYSIGAVLYYLGCKTHPYSDMVRVVNPYEYINQVTKCKHPSPLQKQRAEISPALAKLINSMLAPRAKDRPSHEKIVKFFRDKNNKTVPGKECMPFRRYIIRQAQEIYSLPTIKRLCWNTVKLIQAVNQRQPVIIDNKKIQQPFCKEDTDILLQVIEKNSLEQLVSFLEKMVGTTAEVNTEDIQLEGFAKRLFRYCQRKRSKQYPVLETKYYPKDYNFLYNLDDLLLADSTLTKRVLDSFCVAIANTFISEK